MTMYNELSGRSSKESTAVPSGRFDRCRAQTPLAVLPTALVLVGGLLSTGCDDFDQSQAHQPAVSGSSTAPIVEKTPTPVVDANSVEVAGNSASFADQRTSDGNNTTDPKNVRRSDLADETDENQGAALSEKVAAAKKQDERGNVLEFNGFDSYIDVGPIPFDSFAAFTIEVWVKNWQQTIVYQGKEGDPENSVWLGWGTHGWIIGWESVNGQNYVYKIDREPSRKWEHVALVFDGENQYVFADGKLVHKMPAPKPGPMHKQRRLLVGAQQKWKPSQIGETQRHGYGLLSTLRISSKARYIKPFKPPKNFIADKQTELLYDMSRPDEKTLDDLSAKKRHGKLHEVNWISRAEIEE